MGIAQVGKALCTTDTVGACWNLTLAGKLGQQAEKTVLGEDDVYS